MSNLTRTVQGIIGWQQRISKDRKARKGKLCGESSVAEIYREMQMWGVDADRWWMACWRIWVYFPGVFIHHSKWVWIIHFTMLRQFGGWIHVKCDKKGRGIQLRLSSPVIQMCLKWPRPTFKSPKNCM